MIARLITSFLLITCLHPVSAEAAEIRLYDKNPAHAFNQLHEALFVRVGPDQIEYGLDRVDPLYWQSSQFLLTGNSLLKAQIALENFLKLGPDQFRRLSLRQRAVLQRDLWAVFDSVSNRLERPNQNQTKLLLGLAAGIRRLALSQGELNQLGREAGETYTKILKRSGWVELASEQAHPIAAAHADHLLGRSTSIVLMRSGSQETTISYLRTLFEFPEPVLRFGRTNAFRELNPKLPQLSPQTQFVFARFANLIRNDGAIVPSPIFELFQLMIVKPDGSWQFARAELSRGRYFSGGKNGLVGVSKTDSDFPQLLTSQEDPFEDRGRWFKQNVLQACNSCHLPNIAGVESYARDFPSRVKTPRVDRLVPQMNSVQFELTRRFKESDPNWKRLKSVLFKP